MINNKIVDPDEYYFLFESSQQILAKERLQLKASLEANNGLIVIPNEYLGMSLTEVKRHFEKIEKELQVSYTLKLAALGEAHLRMDYVRRKDFGKKNRKLNIHDAMRALYRLVGVKAQLDKDIIDTWKQYSSNKPVFSSYKTLLQYRHWIAHGRYWPYSGKQFSTFESYVIVNELVKEIRNHPV